MNAVKKQNVSDKDAALHARFHRVGIFILVAGLLAASVVYLRTAPDDESGAIGYEIVDGKSYPIMPGDSKRYEYDLERIGGKAAVMGVEFTDWFGSLWHGRKLACTLAFLSLGGSLVCFVFAHLVLVAPQPDKGNG